MEKELFISGYCRMLDQSRTVCAVTEDDCLTEVDCSYFNCPHTPNCTVAAALRELEQAH